MEERLHHLTSQVSQMSKIRSLRTSPETLLNSAPSSGGPGSWRPTSPALQMLSLNLEAEFTLEQPESATRSPSIDRFIPSRKSSNISNKMHFSESICREESKSILLSKFKSRILGLDGKTLKFSNEAENSPNIPEFLSDKFYETVQSQQRVICHTPFKVLDAPSLEDDFYVSLLDWSPMNSLCVGLTSTVYLWAFETCKVTKLCDMIAKVTAVACSNHSNEVAVANNNGKVQIHDVCKVKLTAQLEDGGKRNRIGTLHWSSKLLASGSSDKSLCIYDLRARRKVVHKRNAHRLQICGIKWSYDDQQLASGGTLFKDVGNDNKLCIWDMRMESPLYSFFNHQAAIKGLSWSPHQHGVLASGGGARDRTIKFWNTTEGRLTHSVDTESQVCNLLFSKNTNELVSTHGYTHNQIMFWKTKNFQHFDTLVGHKLRVLYIALSPDGRTIVTGGGDETLRFWSVFPEGKSQQPRLTSSLSLNENFLR